MFIRKLHKQMNLSSHNDGKTFKAPLAAILFDTAFYDIEAILDSINLVQYISRLPAVPIATLHDSFY
jgi:hypothetical protein